MQIFHQEFETKTVVSAGLVLVIGLMLPVTLFMFNQQQDIRQQAASTTEYNFPAGCAETNPDKSTNTCRPTVSCLQGEYVKWDGNDECTKKLSKTSYCCSTSTRLAP